MDPALAALVEPLVARPERCVLAFDFDGTLSAVVDDPADAVLSDGAGALLAALTERYGRVAVLSGRPLAFLDERVGPSGVALAGLYGLESRLDGERREHPEAEAWRPVVAQAVADFEEAAAAGGPLEGALVEGKGLSLTVHTRTRPDREVAVAQRAAAIAAATGLELRSAKRSVELHPPVAVDKGVVLRSLVDGFDAALYVGDDVGDRSAFDALAAARAEGRLEAVVRVAVGGAEAPASLLAEADAVVDGPAGVVGLLAELAGAR